MTRADLARRIGVSTVTLEKIENGVNPMTRQLAYKICSQLGCRPKLQTSAKGKEIWSVSDRMLRDDDRWTPYTHVDFLAHEERRRAMADDAETWGRGLAGALRLLLGGAARSGQLLSLTTEVEDTLAGWLASYELEHRIRGMLKDEGMPDEQTERLIDLMKVSPVEAGLEYQSHCEAVAAAKPQTKPA
jgi:DNA-binding XRE family transcriptional regulator